MKVMVFGLNPSDAGGRSGTLKTLSKWMEEFEIKYFCFDNVCWDNEPPKSMKDIDFEQIKKSAEGQTKVLALGSKASAVLRHVGIHHYSLPHPSGLNRQLNNSSYVKEVLRLCKEYIWT